MTSLLIALLVVAGVAFRITTPEERQRFFAAVQAVARQLRSAELRRRADLAPFREALRSRTRWTIVTPAILAINLGVFAGAVWQTGPLSSADTLVGWGASFAPRTTNGEWWRLMSSMFVHAGLLPLLVNVVGLTPVALLLERVHGPAALLTVYLAAGTLGSVAGLSAHPMAVSAGGSAAVCGVYALFVVATVAASLQKDAIRIPLRALKGLVPAGVLFVVYTATASGVDSAATSAGMLAGFAGGVVLTIGLGDRKPPLRRIGAALAAALTIAVGTAVPLRGVVDVRPEMERLVAIEDKTTATYWAAVDRFKDRKMSAEALAQLIERAIRPEIEAARERLTGLNGVPPEHQPLVAAAHQYCRLREESWRLRAEGLRKTNMLRLRQAESAERGSLEALERIRDPWRG